MNSSGINFNSFGYFTLGRWWTSKIKGGWWRRLTSCCCTTTTSDEKVNGRLWWRETWEQERRRTCLIGGRAIDQSALFYLYAPNNQNRLSRKSVEQTDRLFFIYFTVETRKSIDSRFIYRSNEIFKFICFQWEIWIFFSKTEIFVNFFGYFS